MQDTDLDGTVRNKVLIADPNDCAAHMHKLLGLLGLGNPLATKDHFQGALAEQLISILLTEVSNLRKGAFDTWVTVETRVG